MKSLWLRGENFDVSPNGMARAHIVVFYPATLFDLPKYM